MNKKPFWNQQFYFLSLALLLIVSVGQNSAYAQEERLALDWSKLDLNPQQSKQIQELDGEWQHEYEQIKPSLIEDQKQLARLLTTHHSDGVEIMTVQSSVSQKQDKLAALAIASYLKKRQVLNENQQHTVETMMRQAIDQHEHNASSGNLTELVPGHLQGLMQRVRNTWTPPQGH